MIDFRPLTMEPDRPERVIREVFPGDERALSWDQIRALHGVLRGLIPSRPTARKVTLHVSWEYADGSLDAILSVVSAEVQPDGTEVIFQDDHPLPPEFGDPPSHHSSGPSAN